MEIIKLNIKGMTCASCVSHVEKAISGLEGVEKVQVNLALEDARLEYDGSAVSIDAIVDAVKHAGYEAEEQKREDNTEKDNQEQMGLMRSFILSAILTSPLLLAMVAMIGKIHALDFLHNPVLQLVLATPVQFVFGFRFYKNAFKSLKAGAPGMDLLVAIGTSAAYLFSIYSAFVLNSSHLYFEASAVIITLILLGKFLEARAKGKTSEAIRKLVGMQPKSARVVTKDADGKMEIQEMPIDKIVPGMIIQLRPGEQVPVDGEIIEGISSFDESPITGESIPLEKGVGDYLYSGSINSYNSIKFKAAKKGSDSTLARIIRIVEEAQSKKAPIQKTADAVAAVFVPVVLLISVITFVVWWTISGDALSGLIPAVAILVIACPCALGLATPAAIMVGTGLGARRGILIRTGESLELAHKINAIVLDKTGTITIGKPEVHEILPSPTIVGQELMQTAAALELHSEHPLAHAILQYCKDNELQPFEAEQVKAIPGKGMEGTVEGQAVFIGTKDFLEEKGISVSINWKAEASALEEKGRSLLYTGRNNEFIGLIALGDTIKPESRAAVAEIKKAGIDVFMITGDNEGTAQAIAEECGIDNILARVLPEEKADKVEALKLGGKIVCMVGDGINDAPALASADIGIAMASGTDVAMESADITLMNSSLTGILDAIRLSGKTMSKIKQNLFWAFFYNILGIPVAALGLLNPMIAGAAMAFSSVSVLSNSLLLKNFKFSNTRSARNKEESSPDREDHMITSEYAVEGMSCGHCKMRVEDAAKQIDGVVKATADPAAGNLIIEWQTKANDEAIKNAVGGAGYPVK